MQLKLLLKRAALLTAANWPVIAIQFAAQSTFYALLAVPFIGAAILVTVLLGADLGALLQGSLQDMAARIVGALVGEPVALASFAAAFAIVLLGGSALVFLIKGGTVEVLLAAEASAGPIECEPLTLDRLRSASRFSIPRFMAGCGRLFGRYAALGLALTGAYVASAAAFLSVVLLGYRLVDDGRVLLGWTLVAAAATVALVIWITLINLLYLLLQIAIAVEDASVADAARAVYHFVRHDYRELAAVFLVLFALVIAATFASALAWSGVGLIAFIPLVGVAVLPLQLAAWVLRGAAFEYLGLMGLSAYAALYDRRVQRRARMPRPHVRGPAVRSGT